MPPEGEKKSLLKQIRTFQGDVAEALERQKDSLVSIQRREQLRRTNASGNTPGEKTARTTELFYLSLGIIVLVVLGAVGAWYGYTEFIRKSATPIIAAPANRFISIDSEINLNFTETSREALIRALTEETRNAPGRELRHINTPFSTEEFLKNLESNAPGNLTRAFSPLFMFGTFGETGNFLIIKLVSFENAFSGMLSWEKDMAQDLEPLFRTANLLPLLLSETTFKDLIDQNKDVRVLYLENEPVLLYSFFDNNMLIITDNFETLRTLIDRLTREKLSR